MVTIPTEFCRTLVKMVPELEKEIEKKKIISMTPRDLAEKMGPRFRSRDPTSIYWGAKECLFTKGIFVVHTKKDHEDVLQMRYRTPEDKLSREKTIRRILCKEKPKRI